jgi:hypothetical protein
MRRLVVVIPAVVRDRRGLEMLRVQSLLCPRLSRANADPGLVIHGCVAYDAIAPELLDETLALSFTVKAFSVGNSGWLQATGIRQPTQRAVDQIRSIFGPGRELYVLRVIQDAVVLDAGSLLAEMVGLIDREKGSFLAGAMEACDDIGPHMEALGLPRRQSYPFAQGAVLFAPLAVWEKHYPRLPRAITHYCDDSVMSQLVTAAGGRLLPLTRHWEHRHDCPVEASRAAFAAQSAELAGPPAG